MGVEQTTKADRNACHTLCRKGKARATLRWLSSTVLPTIIYDIYKELLCLLRSSAAYLSEKQTSLNRKDYEKSTC